MENFEDTETRVEDKTKLPLISVGLIIGYFISQMLCFNIAALIAGIDDPKNFPKALLFGSIAINAFIWIAISLNLMRKLNLPKMKDSNLQNNIKHYFIGIGLMYASMMFVGLLLQLMGFQPQTQNVAQEVQAMGQSNILLAIIGPAIFIPVIEEFLFRGFLYRSLKISCSALIAALISATFFGLVHLEIDTIPQLIILGLIFTWIYEQCGSIWVASALHATNNFITIMVLIFLPDIEKQLQSVVFFLPVFV